MDKYTIQTLAIKAKLCWPNVDNSLRERIFLQELLLSPKTHADPTAWNTAWAQLLSQYAVTNLDWDLIPYHYKQPAIYARFYGDYSLTGSELVVYDLWQELRNHVFQMYLKNTPEVHEYGCGSGLNLLTLARQFPGKKLVGYDVSPAAITTVKLIAERHPEINLQGEQYSFIDGFPSNDTKPRLAIPFKNHAVLTCGALEQVGNRWQSFLNLVMWQQPSICVHVEPLLELYDETLLFDWLAARYHRGRGYLEGFLPAIRQLEKDGRAEIITCDRTYFGNVHNEGFSILVWKPK